MDCDRAKQTNENLKHAAMESTFLLHKPVVYGSSLANGIFLMILLFHIAAAAIAPISAIAAFTVKKGHRAHRHSGQLFAGAMVVVSLTGIILDIVRLCFFVEENHTKYSGYTMPSTYPARLGFLFVGVCILYILREVTPPHVFSQSLKKTKALGIPSLLVTTGLALTGIIAVKLNPWTGALWMIWTFILIVIILSQTTSSVSNHHDRAIAQHRLGSTCLAAFSWWGALQGFGPAIVIQVAGDDLSTTLYVGNQPGSFSPAFLLFFLSWAPFFILAGYLIRRFSKRHQQS